MITTKRQLLSALFLACICASVLGAEPNEAKTKLKFEIKNEKTGWKVKVGKTAEGRPIYYDNPGFIRPTYVAELQINREGPGYQVESELTKEILKSCTAQYMSQKQKDFLATEFAVRLDIDYVVVPNYYSCSLYAVTENDVKKMVEAFIEVLTNKANGKLQKLQARKEELQGTIVEIKKQIAEMESEIKNAEPDLDMIKNQIKYLNYVEAKEAIPEFTKMLNTLDIELSGIKSRLQTIEIYKAKLGKEISLEHRFKLEQMFIEQTIELKAAEARKKTVVDLQNKAQSFYKLAQKVDHLVVDKANLGIRLTNSERNLGLIEERLANPPDELLPPKVLRNKVTIYPVLAEE